MNKCLLIALGVLAVVSTVAAFGGKEVGYEVAIKHIPKYSKYGYGFGESVRYDKRIVPAYVPKNLVPVYLPKKYIGEEVGLGYGGYGMGLGGLEFGGGGVGMGLGGYGLGAGAGGLGGAGFY